MENYIPGTEGYARIKQPFIEATLAIGFLELHRAFAPFFPKQPGRVLDIGAGIGRDASAFARMGHAVTAVEPIDEFRDAGRELYSTAAITWIDGALPELELPGQPDLGFDFILVSGVWHHLDRREQYLSMQRISGLLNDGGILALSLRNGPAGAGTHVFPTDGKRTLKDAGQYGLSPLLCIEHEPSLMSNKEQVSWTRIVLKKQ